MPQTEVVLCQSNAVHIIVYIMIIMEFATEFNAAPKKAGVNNIKCSACHCKHNDHQKCYAEDVQINHVTASCETFEQH